MAFGGTESLAAIAEEIRKNIPDNILPEQDASVRREFGAAEAAQPERAAPSKSKISQSQDIPETTGPESFIATPAPETNSADFAPEAFTAEPPVQKATPPEPAQQQPARAKPAAPAAPGGSEDDDQSVAETHRTFKDLERRLADYSRRDEGGDRADATLNGHIRIYGNAVENENASQKEKKRQQDASKLMQTLLQQEQIAADLERLDALMQEWQALEERRGEILNKYLSEEEQQRLVGETDAEYKERMNQQMEEKYRAGLVPEEDYREFLANNQRQTAIEREASEIATRLNNDNKAKHLSVRSTEQQLIYLRQIDMELERISRNPNAQERDAAFRRLTEQNPQLYAASLDENGRPSLDKAIEHTSTEMVKKTEELATAQAAATASDNALGQMQQKLEATDMPLETADISDSNTNHLLAGFGGFDSAEIEDPYSPAETTADNTGPATENNIIAPNPMAFRT